MSEDELAVKAHRLLASAYDCRASLQCGYKSQDDLLIIEKAIQLEERGLNRVTLLRPLKRRAELLRKGDLK
ncbi:hypothetical protein [Roseibacillus ishigakijimensis]|uniref:Uncharacterized protein n=1 Tax=Roseibacillus ishigakijimensis TaxID=454146 RepID=A0A934RPB5_9BACT|nr:hypothetical protein [Roseibacillus ishigakijimensis]MBK1835034.1 hypothetical protein [Roseibacillus ishigakijimensis]